MFTAVQTDKMRKKSSHFRTSSSLNMAVRGGLTRFARPAGSPLTAFTVCPTGCRQLSTPVGASHPPGVCNIRKKSPYFRTSSSLNMAVRGGFEPPIRCRIHTFQACSFSHSDTSPNCRSCLAGTGANLGKSRPEVNKLFEKIARLFKLQSMCGFNKRNLLFLPPTTDLLCWWPL